MSVVNCREIELQALQCLLHSYGLEVVYVPDGIPIPGSHFGDPEAGLIGNRLYVRADTPVHSALHEACHFICMDGQRRSTLHTDAGGDYAEENGVCYLQILLAEHLHGYSRTRILADMDSWGYSFRLGSAQAWFNEDAEDALAWLNAHGVLDDQGTVTWRCVV